MANKKLGIFILTVTIVAQATLVPAADDGVLQSSNSGPVDYVVGDDKGWCPGVDYEAWVKGKDFYMGDKLVFNYTKGEHNVIKVDEAGYKECTSPPQAETLSNGDDIIMLVAMGGTGFISGVGDDCANGMKLFLPDVKCPHTLT